MIKITKISNYINTNLDLKLKKEKKEIKPKKKKDISFEECLNEEISKLIKNSK